MLTYAQVLLAILNLAKTMVRWAEHNNWMDEGEMRAVNRELLAINKALRIKDKIRAQVDQIPDDYLDTELAADGDLRPDERLPG